MLNTLFLLLQKPNGKNVQETTGKALEVGQAAKDTVIELTNGFFAQLPLIGVGLVIILFSLLIAFFIKNIIIKTSDRTNLDHMLATLLAKIAYIAIFVLGAFIASTVIFPGVSPGDLIAGLGIGSVAFGFAFKDVLQNLFAGFLILFYRPFKIGDQIKIDNFEGAVEEINI